MTFVQLPNYLFPLTTKSAPYSPESLLKVISFTFLRNTLFHDDPSVAQTPLRSKAWDGTTNIPQATDAKTTRKVADDIFMDVLPGQPLCIYHLPHDLLCSW
jgi:hypothetical protein